MKIGIWLLENIDLDGYRDDKKVREFLGELINCLIFDLNYNESNTYYIYGMGSPYINQAGRYFLSETRLFDGFNHRMLGSDELLFMLDTKEVVLVSFLEKRISLKPVKQEDRKITDIKMLQELGKDYGLELNLIEMSIYRIRKLLLDAKNFLKVFWIRDEDILQLVKYYFIRMMGYSIGFCGIIGLILNLFGLSKLWPLSSILLILTALSGVGAYAMATIAYLDEVEG